MFLFVLKSHDEAKRFRYKVIPNWDDIVDLCAKDRAIGIGAESALDADDVMSKEAHEEEEVPHANIIDLEEPSSATKKKVQINRAKKGRDKEGVASSMKEVAESFKEFVQLTKKRMEGNKREVVQEVMNELKVLLDLDNGLRLKAIAWLTKNPDDLEIVKALPLGDKKDYILAFIDSTI